MSAAVEASVINFVVRMVVPMRREFGRALDVQQFMKDRSYARAVLDEALGSHDSRLREHAQYVERHMLGVRQGGSDAAVAPKREAPSPEIPTSGEPTEAELRARMMRKYTGGLR